MSFGFWATVTFGVLSIAVFLYEFLRKDGSNQAEGDPEHCPPPSSSFSSTSSSSFVRLGNEEGSSSLRRRIPGEGSEFILHEESIASVISPSASSSSSTVESSSAFPSVSLHPEQDGVAPREVEKTSLDAISPTSSTDVVGLPLNRATNLSLSSSSSSSSSTSTSASIARPEFQPSDSSSPLHACFRAPVDLTRHWQTSGRSKPSLSIDMSGCVFDVTRNGFEITNISLIESLQLLCAVFDVYMITRVSSDEEEMHVRILLESADMFSCGLDGRKVLFSSTEKGRIAIVRQISPSIHVEGTLSVAQELRRFLPRIEHSTPQQLSGLIQTLLRI